MLTALLLFLRSIVLICGGSRAVALENLWTAAAAGRLDAHGQATPTPREGPTLLDCPGQGVAGVAHRCDLCAAGHRRAVAPRVAAPSVDMALRTEASRTTQHECQRSHARWQDGRGKSPVGRASNPRRIRQAGRRRLGADGVAAAAAPASAAVTDVADLSHEPCHRVGVNGLLHRAGLFCSGCCSSSSFFPMTDGVWFTSM